jgi:hypothetical protein
MKICKYCANEIKDEAIVCRYCGLDLGNKITLSLAQKRQLLAFFRIILYTLWIIVALIYCIYGYRILISLFFSHINNINY